jgi:hypothetical protein
MTEGWNGEDYLILFSADETADLAPRYRLSTRLPGFELLGLRGWDPVPRRPPSPGCGSSVA